MEALYELKQDIRLPGAYFKAGQKQTREEWISLFPNAFSWNDWEEWFYDPHVESERASSLTREEAVVRAVFEKHNLHSMSYKNAALECIQVFHRINDVPDKELDKIAKTISGKIWHSRSGEFLIPLVVAKDLVKTVVKLTRSNS